MNEYDEECIRTFLERQAQLFDEDMAVASTMEEAKEFLEEAMAVVVNTKREVKEYFEENAMDTAGMTMEEILDQSEVFALPSNRFLIVEG